MANSNKSSRTIIALLYAVLLFSTLVNGQNFLARPQNDNSCPQDTLRLGVCANLLNWLINIGIGNPPTATCCPLIQGLVDLEAAVCLCTAIKANVLGIININLQLALTLLLNACGKQAPAGFQCARD